MAVAVVVSVGATNLSPPPPPPPRAIFRILVLFIFVVNIAPPHPTGVRTRGAAVVIIIFAVVVFGRVGFLVSCACLARLCLCRASFVPNAVMTTRRNVKISDLGGAAGRCQYKKSNNA